MEFHDGFRFGFVLASCWFHVGSMIGQVRAMMDSCWIHVGFIFFHVPKPGLPTRLLGFFSCERHQLSFRSNFQHRKNPNFHVEIIIPTVGFRIPAVRLRIPTVGLRSPTVRLRIPTARLPTVGLRIPMVRLRIPTVRLRIPKARRRIPMVRLRIPTVRLRSPEPMRQPSILQRRCLHSLGVR